MAARIAGWAGIVAHLVVGVVPYAASGLVAPLWAIAVLWIVWAALLVVAWRLLRRRPALVPVVPVIALAVWYGALTAGERLLGWTA